MGGGNFPRGGRRVGRLSAANGLCLVCSCDPLSEGLKRHTHTPPPRVLRVKLREPRSGPGAAAAGGVRAAAAVTLSRFGEVVCVSGSGKRQLFGSRVETWQVVGPDRAFLGGDSGGLRSPPALGKGLGGGSCLEGDCWVGFFFLLSFLLVFKTGFSSLKAHSTGNG